MSFIAKIRKQDRRFGIRLYNQWRICITVLAPLFLVGGVAGIFSAVDMFAERESSVSPEQIISSAVAILAGLAFAYLRLTVFREKRAHEQK